ncbi:putative Aaa ATPase domain protein [Gregarina niphandrodes]|uniref:Aaa ATPase domain protein n=1 Tax=Gregarina niphandrodes TaxID=110365 RepID=A0A023B5B3_GRENI|nr:putative Aaa ATPase domain protein [Gregarina niphandrodes]EZG58881.1 putative Aaa ATPase domain protein [Gregarina niphandrodes]|eukprot:XP_011130936.1 putative Aaa ATPase domain protein [Gregarina niphandrodes]
MSFRIRDIPVETNILILGRTGVGKSTWINTFINYLSYSSFDAALQAKTLSWAIPFAFSIHALNQRNNYERKNVRVGFSDQLHPSRGSVAVEESDGSTGTSATPRTVVHRIEMAKRVIRLIDTPGIGDTRGADQDRKNMNDIMRVLGSYKIIHGILILLKPNEQRFDVMFRFCIQELLTHLHRDAAKNIAFGFTNCRSSNYAPGDTFGPLKALLERYNIRLGKGVVYCFDSESFRCLAAHKECGVSLGDLNENRKSWNHSVKETTRLLEHFLNLTPHPVRDTVTLCEVRRGIECVVEPIAVITERVKDAAPDLKRELDVLQNAAAQMNVFLKHNALLTFNDAKLEYLDLQITDERSKVSLGGSRDKLDSFTMYLERCLLVKRFKEHMDDEKKPLNNDQIKELIRTLPSLNHYGKCFVDVRQGIAETKTIVNLEQTYVRDAASHLSPWNPNARDDRDTGLPQYWVD